MAIAACGLLVTMQREGVSQTDQQYSVASRTSLGPSRGLAAIDTAAREGKYLFMFVWKANDEQSRSMHGVFQSTMNKWAQSVNSVGIQVTDTREKPVVDKFGLRRAPMPMVLALAPNGAVTKAFPIQFDENKLREAFVSPCMAQCLKGLQEQKLVLLCVQNDKTQYTQAAMTAAKSFAADARYAKATRIVSLNPKDQTEATFLQDLKVDPHTTEAVTVLLAPPGQPVATFVGAVTKDQIVAKVQAGPCAGGKCGPNGCCPK
jgi:hypothetical protein